MIDLLTDTQARDQIRSRGLTVVDDYRIWISLASAIVMDYITATEDDWVIDGTSPAEYDIPGTVQAAAMLVFGEIYMNRESSTGDPLSDKVKMFLGLHRDPPLA